MTPAAVAVIRAGALRNNLQAIRGAAPGCRVLAVVKANAYGHGLVQVARILSSADGFAVARMDEAIQLRDAGITKRVVVLGGFVAAEEARLAAERRLEVVVHSPEQVEVLEKMGDAGPANLWVKVDTGMGRLGLEPALVAGVLARLRACRPRHGTLRLMTHLASADGAGDPATPAQLGDFARVSSDWLGDVSIANSAAILQWPATIAETGSPHAENWIRPGLMLYGVSPLAAGRPALPGLRPAMSFETRLIAVRHLPRGRHVGYGGDWQAARDSVVGVAAAGYADGYPWHVSRGTPVAVNGRRAPVIGRVSMDMISIDLTDLPPAKAGDRVVLWGDDPPVAEVAACASTISYELLAAISPRVVRQIED